MAGIVRVLTALALACAAPLAPAQPYPARPVKIIVPYPPGGGSDVLGRMIGQQLQEALGQPFVIENRAGATGSLGMDLVAKSAPDGYTLVLNNNTININQSLNPNQPFEVVRDFTPVVLVGTTPAVIGATASFPANSLPEVIAHLRANPGKVSYASCGTGSAHHLAAELVQAYAKVRMVHVPYKGCSQAIPDVLSGRVQLIFNTVANLAPHVKSGKIKAYATTGTKRAQFAAELPTVAEAALPGYVVEIWFGLLGPANLPRDIVAKLNAEANRALERPEVRDRLRSQFFDPLGGSSDQFAAIIRSELQTYGKLIKDAGIRPD